MVFSNNVLLYASMLLFHFYIISKWQPIDAVIVADNGEFTIKLWDCDSISQVKEKILDAIYKNAPVSSRPQISEVDLGKNKVFPPLNSY